MFFQLHFDLTETHWMAECNTSASLLAFTFQIFILSLTYLISESLGYLPPAVVKPASSMLPVSSDLRFVCFGRQKKPGSDTHKQWWRWDAPQIDSLLCLLWRMQLQNLRDQLFFFRLMFFRHKWSTKSRRVIKKKKNFTAIIKWKWKLFIAQKLMFYVCIWCSGKY